MGELYKQVVQNLHHCLKKIKGARLYHLLDNVNIFFSQKAHFCSFVIDFKTSRFAYLFARFFNVCNPSDDLTQSKFFRLFAEIFLNLVKCKASILKSFLLKTTSLNIPYSFDFSVITLMVNMIIHPMTMFTDSDVHCIANNLK